ncbi:MAG: ATP-dependent helicase [Vicinamibacterales bacterium]
MLPPEARWDHELAGVARNIAATNESPLRVLAGPGTGKTYAMKRRVMRLLQHGADGRRILVCTFTRTAARDVAREIQSLGVPGVESVWAGTLHGLCFSTLQRRAVLQVTGREARTLASSEERFLNEDMRSFGGAREAGKKLKAFGSAWARLQTDEPGWPHDPADHAFQIALLEWLRFHEAMLVGELVPITLQYLRENPMCEERRQFEHVIIDEFQDLNRAEQALVDLLAENATLTVIGDEDQSIYSFKHAHPEGIATFDDAHPGTHDETLRECRRCPTEVVALANALIAQNPSASGRPLEPRRQNCLGDIHIVQWRSPTDEAEGIARHVLERIQAGHVTAGQVLVLAPRRQFGYAVRDALLGLGVVAHSFFNEQALDGNPKHLEDCLAQQAYALLTLAADPEDRVALRSWCGFGSESLGEPGWRRIRARADATGESPREILEQVVDGAIGLPHTRAVVERYELLQGRLAALRDQRGQELADRLFPTAETWSEPFQTIVASSFRPGTAFNAEDLLDEVRAGITQPETPTEVDFVRVMSLHKSKGLTSTLVVIMGCIEGAMPRIDFDSSQAEQRRSLEEQRRLFYVAVTRTTDSLVLSSVTHIPPQEAFQMGIAVGPAGRVHTSRFLADLGPRRPEAIRGEDWMGE